MTRLKLRSIPTGNKHGIYILYAHLTRCIDQIASPNVFLGVYVCMYVFISDLFFSLIHELWIDFWENLHARTENIAFFLLNVIIHGIGWGTYFFLIGAG
jgi:hypothetical protein